MTIDPPLDTGAASVCYRHPDRETRVRCTRCERYVCPDCARVVPVGHECVECIDAVAVAAQKPPVPVITYGLIAVNVVMFVLQTASKGVYRELVLWAPGIALGDVYRLLTGAFLHIGIAHLLFNMWALYVCGPPLEAWLGRLRFIALYLISALGGAVLVYLLSPIDVPTAGASGAIFGLFGATFVLARRLNFDVRWVVGLIVLNLVFTFASPQIGGPEISWQGHVGGLLTGAVVAAAYEYAPAQRRGLVQTTFSVVVLVVLAGLVWWRSAALLSGVG